MYKSWLIVSKCTDVKLINVINFVVNDVQTLVNIIKISDVQMSLLNTKSTSAEIDKKTALVGYA